MSIYDFNAKDINGKDISLSKYKGKVLLIVNTATGCGFTPQYNALEALYKKYEEKGFEILDFPCNQFGKQAPGEDHEIKDFCEINFGVSFDQFSKIEVNGKNEHPLYTYLKSRKGGILGNKIKWNFTKFLINKNGEVVARFAPNVKPENIENDIIKLL
ncbi:MAG: glutathione peroxidase [Ruminococcaceae bacterium]|nr:glutathione peroxidase [Oscillospiraceae bacterium]